MDEKKPSSSRICTWYGFHVNHPTYWAMLNWWFDEIWMKNILLLLIFHYKFKLEDMLQIWTIQSYVVELRWDTLDVQTRKRTIIYTIDCPGSIYNQNMPKAQSFTQLTVQAVFMIWICQLTLIAKVLYAKSGIVKIPYAKIPIDKIPYAESALCQNSNCQNTLEPH